MFSEREDRVWLCEECEAVVFSADQLTEVPTEHFYGEVYIRGTIKICARCLARRNPVAKDKQRKNRKLSRRKR